MRSLRAAAVQMVSSTDPETNISTMKRLVCEAAEQGADWVLLPEYWPLMGKKDTDKLAFAEPLDDGRVGETCPPPFSDGLKRNSKGMRRGVVWRYGSAAKPKRWQGDEHDAGI